MAIAREDAVLHGGTLDAIGVFGEGSRFRLIVPRTPNRMIEEEPIPLIVPHAMDSMPPPDPDAPGEEDEDEGPGVIWPSDYAAGAFDEEESDSQPREEDKGEGADD